MRRKLYIIGCDLALLMAAFVVVHALNYGDLNISEANWDVLQLQLLVWLFVSTFLRKFGRIFEMSFVEGVGFLLKSCVFMLFLLSFIIVALHLLHFSRTMAYGTVIVFLALESAFLSLFLWWRGPVAVKAKSYAKPGFWLISGPLLFIDGVLLVASFLTVTFLKRGSYTLSSPYDDILLILLGLWLGGSLLTRKFSRHNFNDFFSAIGPALKTVLFMAAGLAFFIYILRLGPVSRFQVFFPLVIFFVIEALIFALFVNYREHRKLNGDIEDPEQVKDILDAHKHKDLSKGRTPLEATPARRADDDPAKEKLQNALDFFDPRIFELLRENVPLDYVERNRCSLMSTDNLFNFNVLESGNNSLIINLHKLNDIRWFNRYFLLVHQKLIPGGCFMGKAHTISTHRDYFREKYPGRLGVLYYGVSFLWNRVFPKLPWLQKFYFSLTGGRSRVVSRAEILGRLCFCGFKIVAEAEFGHRFYFIAQKTSTPSLDEHPTYGPLVRLNRTGMGGQPITVYKFRTMYPFSEYLQDYIYEHNNLGEGGKFKDDFRVTGWGHFMRRTWIDELPMLYNWLRGDLQLVGVRPLSSQYLALYDPELRVLRQKVKPGLLPPFYADLPTTIEEIMESELRYIQAFLERPLMTQLRYFWKCFWNIGVRGKRSS